MAICGQRVPSPLVDVPHEPMASTGSQNKGDLVTAHHHGVPGTPATTAHLPNLDLTRQANRSRSATLGGKERKKCRTEIREETETETLYVQCRFLHPPTQGRDDNHSTI